MFKQLKTFKTGKTITLKSKVRFITSLIYLPTRGTCSALVVAGDWVVVFMLGRLVVHVGHLSVEAQQRYMKADMFQQVCVHVCL